MVFKSQLDDLSIYQILFDILLRFTIILLLHVVCELQIFFRLPAAMGQNLLK